MEALGIVGFFLLIFLFFGTLATLAVGMICVFLITLWVVASIIFAPFAGWMYERAAFATGGATSRWALRRSGMIRGALFIIPWVYMMRDARGDTDALSRWLIQRRRIYQAWLFGPILFFSGTVIGGLAVALVTSLPSIDAEPFYAWLASVAVLAAATGATLGSVASFLRSLQAEREASPSSLRPYAWTLLWVLVAVGPAVALSITLAPQVIEDFL